MGDFWKPTAEAFTALIEKPKMTEKLLLKPPFKYLFDIISETIKKTGFGNSKTYLTKICTLELNLMQNSTQTKTKR